MLRRALVIALTALGGLAGACDGGGDVAGQHLTFGNGSGGGGTQFGSGAGGGGGTQFGSSQGSGGTAFGTSKGVGGMTFGAAKGLGGTSFSAGNTPLPVPGGGGALAGSMRAATCAAVCAYGIECGSNLPQAECEALCAESVGSAQLSCSASAATCAALAVCLSGSGATDGGAR